MRHEIRLATVRSKSQLCRRHIDRDATRNGLNLFGLLWLCVSRIFLGVEVSKVLEHASDRALVNQPLGDS